VRTVGAETTDRRHHRPPLEASPTEQNVLVAQAAADAVAALDQGRAPVHEVQPVGVEV